MTTPELKLQKKEEERRAKEELKNETNLKIQAESQIKKKINKQYIPLH